MSGSLPSKSLRLTFCSLASQNTPEGEHVVDVARGDVVRHAAILERFCVYPECAHGDFSHIDSLIDRMQEA